MGYLESFEGETTTILNRGDQVRNKCTFWGGTVK